MWSCASFGDGKGEAKPQTNKVCLVKSVNKETSREKNLAGSIFRNKMYTCVNFGFLELERNFLLSSCITVDMMLISRKWEDKREKFILKKNVMIFVKFGAELD